MIEIPMFNFPNTSLIAFCKSGMNKHDTFIDDLLEENCNHEKFCLCFEQLFNFDYVTTTFGNNYLIKIIRG